MENVMREIINILLGITLTGLFVIPIVIIIVLTLDMLFDLKGKFERIKRRRFKPKSRTERKVRKEIKRIECEIEERKRLEHLYEKRDELIRKIEGWHE